MKLNVAKINDEKRIVVGTVVSVEAGNGGKVQNVKLEGTVWNRDERVEETKVIDIAFWNNDKVNMADRVVTAQVKPGVVISVEVYEKDGKITGNNFKYGGQWTITAPNGKEKNIFHGIVGSMKPDTEDRFVKVSMPIKNRSDEEDSWVYLTFWNNEDNNVADRAKKCLGKRKIKDDDGTESERSRKAIIICGEKKSEYNGSGQYTAFDFIVLD